MSRKHGHAVDGAVTPEYMAWQAMYSRCLCPSYKGWKRYGGRGVTICERWKGHGGFANFLADMGPRPGGKYLLDRYPDRNGNYEPGNCRWATALQSVQNRDCTILLTCQGRTQTAMEWSKETGVPYTRITSRVRRGWSHEDAIWTPPQEKKRLITWNGKSLTLRGWEAETGIPYGTLKQRLFRYGFSVEDALTQPLDQGMFLTWSGRTQNLPAWSKETGISYDAIAQRIRNGWTVERTLTTPTRRTRHSNTAHGLEPSLSRRGS